MHRFTDSMPGRALISHLARNYTTHRIPTNNATAKRKPAQASSSQPWILPMLLISLTGSLVGCGGSATPEEISTATTTVDTAEVFNTPPSLTIVAPEGTRPDNSAFVQVAENSLNVTQVAAEDIPGSTLIYRLQDGEDKDKFVLDESTGTLRFKDLPDWEDPVDADTNNNYMLLWQVISSSGDARSQFMVIQVTDLPD